MFDKDFHCQGECKFLHKGRPDDDDLQHASDFARALEHKLHYEANSLENIVEDYVGKQAEYADRLYEIERAMQASRHKIC